MVKSITMAKENQMLNTKTRERTQIALSAALCSDDLNIDVTGILVTVIIDLIEQVPHSTSPQKTRSLY